MSSVFQFRLVTLIALTKSVDQTTVRVTSHSFNKLTMFRSVPLYFVSRVGAGTSGHPRQAGHHRTMQPFHLC